MVALVKVVLGGCTVDALTVGALWMYSGYTVDVLWIHCGCKAWPPQYSLLRVRLMFKDAYGDNPPPVASLLLGTIVLIGMKYEL